MPASRCWPSGGWLRPNLGRRRPRARLRHLRTRRRPRPLPPTSIRSRSPSPSAGRQTVAPPPGWRRPTRSGIESLPCLPGAARSRTPRSKRSGDRRACRPTKSRASPASLSTALSSKREPMASSSSVSSPTRPVRVRSPAGEALRLSTAGSSTAIDPNVRTDLGRRVRTMVTSSRTSPTTWRKPIAPRN